MVRKAIQLWNDYWFSTGREYQYGLARIVCVAALAYFFPDPMAAPPFPVEFYAPATIGVRVFGLPYPSAELIHVLTPVYRLALATACVGLASRPSLLLVAGIRFYADAVANSFGFYDHRTSVVDPFLLVLALAPGVSDFSVDLLLRHAWSRLKGNPVPWRHGFRFGTYARWPARFIIIFIALNYFSAGWSKIRFGNEWINGERMAFYLTVPGTTYFASSARIPASAKWKDSVGLESFTYDARCVTPIGAWLGSFHWICVFIAWMTLAFEMGFPLAILSRRLRPLFFLGGIGFHIGIMLTMKLNFFSYFLAYFFVMNWETLESGYAWGKSAWARLVLRVASERSSA